MSDDTTIRNTTGSTMTPNNIHSTSVTTGVVESKQLKLGGGTAEGISTNYKDKNPHNLSSAFSLEQLYKDLMLQLDELKKQVEVFILSPVVSPAITNPQFSEGVDWTLYGFYIDAAHLIYTNDQTYLSPSGDQAVAKLESSAFTSKGTHFLDIHVKQLPLGTTLSVVDSSTRQVLGSTVTEEDFKIIFNVEHPDIFSIEIVLNGVPEGESVMFTHVGVHRVKEEFTSYMEYALEGMLSGESGFVTMKEVTAVTELLRTSLMAYISNVQDQLDSSVRSHLSDITSNPHKVTTSMIGAADKDHTHSYKDIPGLLESIVVPFESVTVTVKILETFMNLHMSTENPHGITIDMIGAASATHVHEFAEIEGLEAEILNIRETISQTVIEANKELTDAIEAIRKICTDNDYWRQIHINDPNYGHDIHFATSAEVQDGTIANKFMNPANTKVAIEAHTSIVPEKDVERVQARLIQRVHLKSNSFGMGFVNIPIELGAQYQIKLAGANGHNLSHVFFDVDCEDSEGRKTERKRKEWHNGVEVEDNMPYFSHKLTSLQGTGTMEFKYDTLYDTVTGSGVRYLDVGIGMTTMMSAPEKPVEMSSVSTLTIAVQTYNNVEDRTTFVDVYELIPYQENVVVADMHPVGTIITRYGDKPIQGYSLLDGSRLSRTNYNGLFAYALAAEAIIPQADWDKIVAEEKYCEWFGDGDGYGTFTLPLTYEASTVGIGSNPGRYGGDPTVPVVPLVESEDDTELPSGEVEPTYPEEYTIEFNVVCSNCSWEGHVPYNSAKGACPNCGEQDTLIVIGKYEEPVTGNCFSCGELLENINVPSCPICGEDPNPTRNVGVVVTKRRVINDYIKLKNDYIINPGQMLIHYTWEDPEAAPEQNSEGA